MQSEFKGLRSILLPIHNFELKKFLPMAAVMFAILFNYTALRDTKDALVVNETGSSAVIAFLKPCVLISAVLFVMIYSKLANIFDQEKIFYVVTLPFMLFFGLFGFVLYPMVDHLHMSKETIASLQEAHPFFQSIFDVAGYWTYSLFYVLGELWGSVMIGLMFWQFANRVTPISQSKRFYPLFGSVANMALILSGGCVWFFSTGFRQYFPEFSDQVAWAFSIKFICASIVLMCMLAMFVFWWMHRSGVLEEGKEEKKPAKKKLKLGFLESVKLIFSTPELAYIAILVIAYGVTINLVELQWKNQMRINFAGAKDAYNAFMGKQSMATGIFTVITAWLVGGNVMRRVPWVISALVTPLTVILLGGTFFALILGQKFDLDLVRSATYTPAALATYIGVVIVVISKSLKYIFFDPTKEMAYIPLDAEVKTKGKAAVDVVAARLGKAGGAFTQGIILSLYATKDMIMISPITGAILAAFCIIWILAVKGLNLRIKRQTEKAA